MVWKGDKKFIKNYKSAIPFENDHVSIEERTYCKIKRLTRRILHFC